MLTFKCWLILRQLTHDVHDPTYGRFFMRKQEKNVIKSRFNGKRTKSRKNCLENIFIQKKKACLLFPKQKKSKNKKF